MFHWICPECGREIPPAMTECPACDPKLVQSSTPAVAPVQAIPEAVAAVVPPAPPVTQIPVPAVAPVLSSAPESKPPDELPMDPLLVLAERIRAAQLAAQPVRAPQLRELAAAVGSSEAPTLELIPVPAVARPTPGTLALAERVQPAALLAPPKIEAPPAPVALAEPIPAPAPLVVPQEIRLEPVAPLVEAAPVALAEPVPAPLPPAAPQEVRQEPVALAEPVSVPLPAVPQEIRQEPVTPLVEAAPVALAEPVSAPLPAVPQELRQEPVAPVIEAAPAALDETVSIEIPQIVPQEFREEPVALPVEPPPVALAAPVSAPLPQAAPPEIRQELIAPSAAPVSAPEPLIVPQEIRQDLAATAMLPARPAAALAEPVPTVLPVPQAPQESRPEPQVEASAIPAPETLPAAAWLKLAPLQNYSRAAARAMRPAAPPARILTPDSGPRITLPGPALPQQLNVRENLQVVTVAAERPRKQRSLPGWVISFLVMTGLLAAGVAVVVYLLPASHSAADAKSAAPETVTAPAVEASHPLAQSIEVTGFRFVIDPNKKSEIHYLVVNHSGSELSDMTVFVTVRSATAKSGQPPLCRFSFRSTGLAAFESKEMTSSIEKAGKGQVSPPDWHDLRAEVQIAQ